MTLLKKVDESYANAVLRIVRNCHPDKGLTRGTISSLPRRFSEVLLLDARFVPHF
jgi:hypothetical protein